MSRTYSPSSMRLQPQLHSRDYLVRLGQHQLAALGLEHLDTALLGACAEGFGPTACAGVTEWQGSAMGSVVSIGWDWVRLRSGELLMPRAVAPRSNIRLVDARGYDMEPAAEALIIWQSVDALPWREQVHAALSACPQSFPIQIRAH